MFQMFLKVGSRERIDDILGLVDEHFPTEISHALLIPVIFNCTVFLSCGMYLSLLSLFYQ
jgi:hypothetical protein